MSGSVGFYRLTTDFTTAGGGQCRWAFAVHDGEEYFLKEFLAPTYPLPEAPGSPATKKRKLRKCEAFEEHHRSIIAALEPLSKSGGNLVTTHEFFRVGAKYYKVTEKVDTTPLPPEKLAREPVERRLLVLITAAHSLDILHRAGLVHGDIKPENILIKTTVKGYRTAKLIDFDNAFFSGRPVPPEDMVGDPNYYSPELFHYLSGSGVPRTLGTASDIFALGLVAVNFLTGSQVFFDSVPDIGHYPGELCGAEASYRTGLEHTSPADTLVRSMLAAQPNQRPTAARVIETLRGIRMAVKQNGDWPTEAPAGTRLRGRLLKAAKGEEEKSVSDPVDQHPGERSELRGSLLRHRDTPSK